jgi:hypothetical protein
MSILRRTVLTPAIEATPDYSSGDVLGGVQEITGLINAVGQSGYLRHFRAVAEITPAANMDLLLFRQNPAASTVAENGAFVLHASDRAKLLGSATILAANWRVVNGTVAFGECFPDFPIFSDDLAARLYGIVIPRETLNFATTSGLQIGLVAEIFP